MDSGDVLTTGRCLEGQVGAHNMCVVANDEASAALRNSYDSQGKYLAFAIGGEYRDRRDRRGKHESYDGISLYGLKPLTQSWQNWSTLEFQKIKRFLKGDHPGQIEGRSKCTQHGVGFSEFDGQSALAWWNGEYWLYARSNPKESGHRSVQVCHGKTLETLGAFQMCTFTGVASGIAGYDIYFLHPYVLPNKKGMMALMSFDMVLRNTWSIFRRHRNNPVRKMTPSCGCFGESLVRQCPPSEGIDTNNQVSRGKT